MSESVNTRISARDIVTEILRNMREGAEEMYTHVLVPSVYQVFLNDRDFQRLQPIGSRIAADAQVALAEALTDLNRRNIIDKLVSNRPTRFECAGKEWCIQLFSDPDDELAPGALRVRSELLLQPKAGAAAGAVTRFTITGTAEVSESEKQGAQEEGADIPIAEVRYTEGDSQRRIVITKDEFLIGRGGPETDVDLQLLNSSVSELHIRIRRNPVTGAFLLENRGRFGTSVDGRSVPRGSEVVLPRLARIGLANDTSMLEFAAMG